MYRINMEDKIVLFAEDIFSTLGRGFSERVYHNAMEVSLRYHNIQYETERVIDIKFKDHVVGHVRADLIVDKSIVVELKVTTKLKPEHIEQCRMYMRLLDIQRGIVINFPEKDDTIEVIDVLPKTDFRV